VFGSSLMSTDLIAGTQPGTGLYSAGLRNGRYGVGFALAGSAPATALVVCCASAPLRDFTWQVDPNERVGIYALWTDYGWKPAGTGPLATPAPFKGLYFYSVLLLGVATPPSLVASLETIGPGPAMNFYTPLPDAALPIPPGFAPVVARNAADLINELFRVNSAVPTVFGIFNSPGSSVTAAPEGGTFKILLTLDNQGYTYTVTNKIYACSDAGLKQWFQNATSPASTRSMWTVRGWQTVAPGGPLDEAVAVDGLYFYCLELVNAQLAGAVAAIESVGVAATVVFYTPA
jgi:hypothetical protein